MNGKLVKKPADKEIRKALLEWFKLNGRKFYWRTHIDPYTVLMVEILLKKTTAGVIDRFLPVFLERYPNIHALYVSPLSDLEHLLAPLGLSKQRAIQLKALSKTLVESYNGQIPCEREKLLKLPGVGDYTAGAVLSFACGMPEAIVDTNIARLITRLFGVTPSHHEARRSPEVWQKAKNLIGDNGIDSKQVNWALLDFSAAICKARNPLHEQCPIKKWCVFYANNAIR